MKHLLLVVLFFLGGALGAARGQTLRALEKAGDEAVRQKNYYTAMVHFSDALSIDPENAALCYKYAEVARQFKAYQTALTYYEKVAASPEADRFPLALFWQAMLEKSLGNFSGAERLLVQFLTTRTTSPLETYYTDRAKEELAWCRAALKGQAAADPNILVEQTGKSVNTDYSEFAPMERGDTLFYTSYRFDKPDEKNDPAARKISKLLISVNGGRGRALTRSLNDELKSTAHIAFSRDGARLYFTLCDYVSEGELRCKLFYRERDKYGKWGRKATELPSPINEEGFTSTQPALGYDSLVGQEILFFVSDRPGGKGKLDIWQSTVEEQGFSPPKPLEALNTAENDVSPFFDPAGQTLYFSTDGRTGWGAYDIWKSSLDSSRWTDPAILPAPINSGFDDLYFSLSPDPERAWLASNRPGSFYLDPDNQACCNDIYKVTYLPPPPPGDTLELVTTIPVPAPELPPNQPQTLEDFLPLALYFDNDEPDKRTNRTTTRKTYSETFNRYYVRKDEYIEAYSAPLNEDLRFEATDAMEAFFEEEVLKGHEHLRLFSDILLRRLENGDRVEIFVKGYTSPRARSDYNLALGQRRVSSVRNHFQTYRDGIFQPFLASGQLIVTERSFGETQASREVSDELGDLRNSVYSIGAARERRVEIVEIQSDKAD